METVRTGLDRSADNAALEVSKLRRGVAGNQVELLDGIGRRGVTQQVIRHLVVIHAVEQEIIRLLAVAIDQRPAAIKIGIVAAGEAGRIGRYRPGRKQGQLDVIARGQRQIIVGGRVDDGIDLRGLCLQDRRRAGHFNRLGDLADFQCDVDACNLIQREDKCRVRDRSESRLFHFEFIIANRELRDAIDTGIVGHGRISEAAFHRLCDNRGPGDSPAARVRHRASHRSSDLLCPDSLRSP